MAQKIQGPDGKSYDFPDDVSDQEILSFFEPKPAQTPAPKPPSSLQVATDNVKQLSAPLWSGIQKAGEVVSYPGNKVEEYTGAGQKLGALMAAGARKEGTPGILPWGQARWQAPFDKPEDRPRAPVVTAEEQARNEQRLRTVGEGVGRIATDPLTYVGGTAIKQGKNFLGGLRGLFNRLSAAPTSQKAIPAYTGGPYPEHLPTPTPSTMVRNQAGGFDTAGTRKIASPPGAQAPKAGDVTPPTPAPAFAPRPSVAPESKAMPTASEVATARSTPPLPNAAEAGVARRRAMAEKPKTFDAPPDLPNPVQTGTAPIQYPSAQLMKQLGIPLAGVAGILPFLERLLRPQPPQQR